MRQSALGGPAVPADVQGGWGGDEASDLCLQVAVLGGAEEAAVGHRLEDVELGLDAGGTELAVHAHGVGEEEVACAALEERGRERRDVAEQR